MFGKKFGNKSQIARVSVGLAVLLVLQAVVTTPQAAAARSQVSTPQPPAPLVGRAINALARLAYEAADGTAPADWPKTLTTQWEIFLRAAQQARGTLLENEAQLRGWGPGFDDVRARVTEQLKEFDANVATIHAGYAALQAAQRAQTYSPSGSNAAALTHQLNRFRATLEGAEAPQDADAPPAFPVLTESQLSRAQMAALETQSNGQPALMTANNDLAPTEDAALTSEISAQAAALGNDPVRIYDFVYNNIAYEPYNGSRKGALLTLWERSGNDVDIASLLLALLRTSGYPTRYVVGKVAIPAAGAGNWVGNSPSLSKTLEIFATGNISTTLDANGAIVKDHVWVTFDPAGGWKHKVALPFVGRSGGGVAARQLESKTVRRWGNGASVWVELDASYKQFTYRAPANIAAITGFSATQWVSELRANVIYSDAARATYGLPMLPRAGEPEHTDSDGDTEWVDARVDAAIGKLEAHLAANPNLSSDDLLGGARIITKTFAALPTQLPFSVTASVTPTEYISLPRELRLYVSVEVGASTAISTNAVFTASLPSLSNKRVTISFIAATPQDQATIDRYGALIKTPPGVNLIPVLKVGGQEMARGGVRQHGRRITRTVRVINTLGQVSTWQNGMAAGDTIAFGFSGAGHTSADAIAAGQARLNAAKSAIPKLPDGSTNPNAPQLMSEAVIGESLHLAFISHRAQSDMFSEMLARSKQVRKVPRVAFGVAMQNVSFDYIFGVPFGVNGGGFGFDLVGTGFRAVSLSSRADDVVAVNRVVGRFDSTLEHAIWEQLGRRSLSTMRLLEVALARGIPVFRLTPADRDKVSALLQLNASVESNIRAALNKGWHVTVHQKSLTLGDWEGEGWIEEDPTSGGASYWISGGLGAENMVSSGGSLWDLLKTIAAYFLALLNVGLDVWGLVSAIGILLVATTPLGLVLGGLLLIASLVALGFDLADLSRLISGEASADQYLAEQALNLVVGAVLKKLGISAFAKIVDKLDDRFAKALVDQVRKVICGTLVVAAVFVGTAQGTAARIASAESHATLAPDIGCASVIDDLLARGLSNKDMARLLTKLPADKWQLISDVAVKTNDINVVRQLINNDYFLKKGAVERVAKTILDAPPGSGLADTIQKAVSRGDFGYAYELVRAVANKNAGAAVTGYGQRINVSFRRITGFEPDGTPIRSNSPDTQPLECDVCLAGNVFVDAKHGTVGSNDLRIWNQVQKAQAAIDAGQISEFRFEASASISQKVIDWAKTNAPDVKFVTGLGDGLP